MTLLDDPVRSDDPFLDPDGPAGRRVLAAATRAPVPQRRRRRRRWVAVVAVAAAAVPVALVALPRGEPDALAAMQRAAVRTAAFDSGRVEWTIDSPRLQLSGDLRYEGGDSLQLLSGPAGRRTEVRSVAGTTYLWHDGRWGRLDNVMAELPGFKSPPAEQLVAEVTGVQRDGDAFSATVPADAVDKALPSWLLNQLRRGGDEPIAVRATVRDGLVETLELRVADASLSFRYSELGQPQPIAIPALPRPAARGR